MEQNQRICKKCLLSEMQESEYFHNLYDYISRLDEDIKTDESKYQDRLHACKACDSLMSGMCRICGCFVEMRAVIDKNICPHTTPKW